jgi:uncharacterized membrane protein
MTDRFNTYQKHENKERSSQDINISEPERVASLVGGAGSILFGLSRRNVPGLLMAVVGGYLTYRGITGYCPISDALGINTAQTGLSQQVSVPHNQGIRFDKHITVNRPVEEIYAFWRNFENLPRIMHHLEDVVVTGDGMRSFWTAKAPLGATVSWEAEIINDVPNERIGWRSLEGADVPNAGSVSFKPAPGGRGTEVHVNMKYDPPGGQLGSIIAKLFGEEPEMQIQEDLYRFRQLMEAGEISTSVGQTSGREKGKDLRAERAKDETNIANTLSDTMQQTSGI